MAKKTSKSTAKGPSRSRPAGSKGQQQQPQPHQQLESQPHQQHQQQQHHQRLLDVYSRAFADVLHSSTLTSTLQKVKQALFERDFKRAFGRDEYLEAYAARWSPTRALCYDSVLRSMGQYLGQPEPDADNTDTDAFPPLHILSIGGGAAETVAVGGFLGSTTQRARLLLLDSAPWGGVAQALEKELTTPPPLSRYASVAARAANAAVVAPEQLAVSFVQCDALALDREELAEHVGGGGRLLVTLLFVLNELLAAAGAGKATGFLLALASAVPAGSLLLVVDSSGSYAETAVGKEARRYPMGWLLDRILLGDEDKWTKLESQDSVWFRLPEGLSYPIPLEDMRYQVHLYRRE